MSLSLSIFNLRKRQKREQSDERIKLTREAQDAEKYRLPREREATQPADPRTVVRLCTEANVPQIAHGMIQRREPLLKVRLRIDNARATRDAFAAAGVLHLADHAVDSLCDVSLFRSILLEVTAMASADEIDHHYHPPEEEDRA